MFDTLSEYLELNATPEQKQVCLVASQGLVDANITDHVDIIADEIAAIEGTALATGDLMVSLIYGLLLPMYRRALVEFGIVLADDTQLPMATDILSGLRQLGNYGDPATINSLCDDPEGTEAALADILELVGAYHACDYLVALDSVNPDLLDRLEELTRQDTVELLPSEAEVVLARSRVQKFLQTFTTDTSLPFLISQYLQDGGRLGLPADELLPQFRDRLNALTGVQIAVELVGLVVASGNPYDFLYASAKNELEHITADMDKLSQAAALLQPFLNKVTNA